MIIIAVRTSNLSYYTVYPKVVVERKAVFVSSSSSALQPGVGLGLPHNAPPFFLTPHLFPPSSNLHNPQVLLQVM
jgi:hypothetical protein